MAEIFIMLSKSYMRLILIAIVISVPLASYAMNSWLEQFAYRTGVEVWVILLAAGSCLVLALGTIFFQSYKSLQANPIKSLKSE
jgi:putative ABC transport system permease protein